ncbi:F-box domain containing protein [Melia azedarach]|uniref:F-box domain containing protein n=1 Tax=Melia azedarach TaxID=155640 RepID=A0ACC1WZ55_MELAZ|nr:F-box domain containing protein [Melia azedarach]
MEDEQNSWLDFRQENMFQILTPYEERDIYDKLAEKQRGGKFHVTKSKTIVGKSSVTDLPDEILFQILTKFPAEDLHDNIRFVCKRWHKLISSGCFISQHMQQNKSQLLIVTPVLLPCENRQVKQLEKHVKALDFNLNTAPIPRMAQQILSSFNGLILIHDREHRRQLHVVNLANKFSVTLPSCPSACEHVGCGTAITLDPSTSEYKIVHMFADGFGLEIFTLGCPDKAWKRIRGPFRVPEERPFNVEKFRWENPVCINGQFLHWSVGSDEYIVSMNISNEKWRRIHLPGNDRYRYRYDLLDIEGNLALFYKVSNTQIDVWVLEDYEKQGWIQRYSIMSESRIHGTRSLPEFRKLHAVTALEDGHLIMFRHQRGKHDLNDCYCLYDIKQRELKRSRMKIKRKTKFIHHKSSLLVCSRNEKLADKDLKVTV